MQEIMTVDSMKDYMRAAGQYAARIADLTQEIQELVGDVLPHYSGWHVSGARGSAGLSKVEQAMERRPSQSRQRRNAHSQNGNMIGNMIGKRQTVGRQAADTWQASG